MLRRRATPDAPAAPAEPAEPARPAVTPSLLDAQGWLLPKALANGTEAQVTLVGTLGSPTATEVDPAGLVVGAGWSLDWWIGADDRWHLPADEAAVRQQRVAEAPVVETLVRVPGGDAVHRAYGIRSPRPVGDEWVVAEVENRTPVPFAVCLVVRPFLAGALGDVHEISVEKVPGGRGRDGAHLVRVDGVPAVVLPRGPARVAAGSLADGDALQQVVDGVAGTGPVVARCDDGFATLALVFPLPHTAVLRAVVPVGEGSEAGALVPYPSVVPDAAAVASGWEVHRRTPRFDVPDQRLAEGLARARTDVLLAHDGGAVRRDGRRAPALEPDATVELLAAFDVLDRPTEAAQVIAGWPGRVRDPEAWVDEIVLDATAHHWLLHRPAALLEGMLTEVAAAVERLGRAHRRGRLDPARVASTAGALRRAAWMLEEAGQADGAKAVDELADRIDPEGPHAGPSALGRSAPERDLAGAACTVLDARRLLVGDRRDGLDLVTDLPDLWYGGGIEVHDAPTAHGRLSYAVRWHGARPAVLWDLEPHRRDRPATLRSSGLDPSWTTTELRGEALLAEIPPPEGLDLVTVVAEHPDIDPAMRRPGRAPIDLPDELPEGGSFS